MRILGIDPGIATTGFGIVDYEGNQLKAVQYGSIRTKADLPVPRRLKQIYDACKELLDAYRPTVVTVERLFFNRNVTTAFVVGQARGVIILAAEEAGVDITEYTPLQVKQAVVGYGNAEKQQVQDMVKMLLKLPDVPKPDDVADALGIAICEAHSAKLSRQVVGIGKRNEGERT